MTAIIGTNIDHAASLIADGKLVAFATETVYGLGANAFDSDAVAQVFSVKQRPSFDPLIVHLDSIERLNEWVPNTPPLTFQLAEKFWPGPLSLVLSREGTEFSDLVSAGLQTVAVRVPQHPMARALIAKADCPIAAPSANLFGHVSPTTAEHVAEQLGDEIDYILDGGPCSVGVESTVVRIVGDRLELLRHGGIPIEDLQAVNCGEVIDVTKKTEASPNKERPLPSPGMTERHYAPRTPLTLIDDLPASFPAGRYGIISLNPRVDIPTVCICEILSSDGNLVEAATNLFAAMRRLDTLKLDGIFAIRLPNHGLGVAMNDRLNRAQHR